MSKIKTISSITKRFKITSSGMFKHKHSNMRHILTKKSSNRKRNLKKMTLTFKGDINLINRGFLYK